MKHGKYLLCGGLRLTTHAADQLHPYMDGSGDEPISHMDPRTVTFMKRANLASPVLQRPTPTACVGIAQWLEKVLCD